MRGQFSIASQSNSGLLSDVPHRMLTICFGVPIIWCIWLFPITRSLFFQCAHVLMCWEWTSLSKMQGFSKIAFLVMSFLAANIKEDGSFLVCLILFIASFPLIILGSTAPSDILSSTSGFLLVTAPNRTWLNVSADFHVTVSLLLTVWNADTGALVAGRIGTYLGTNWPRPQWLKNVSPAKSVEGLVGGFLCGVITYWALPWFWMLVFSYGLGPPRLFAFLESSGKERLWTGAALSTSAILGDLWESSLKRSFKVKDSGKLLPGHGGVLDRFDSSLIPVLVYHYVYKK